MKNWKRCNWSYLNCLTETKIENNRLHCIVAICSDWAKTIELEMEGRIV